jgi:hypothetical protein
VTVWRLGPVAVVGAIAGACWWGPAGAVYWLVSGGFVDALRQWPRELQGTRTAAAAKELWAVMRGGKLP